MTTGHHIPAWDRWVASIIRRRMRRHASDPAPHHGASYTIHVTRDRLDGGWTAECVDLPGCVSDGDTQSEAIANLIDAMSEVIAARAALHIPAVSRKDQGQDRTFALNI